MKTETVVAAGRVSDLHRSAFWIYGVTAMVMRAPFESVIRHAATAGVSDWQVRLEMLRVFVVLGLMSRLFLASGLYFDQVYVRPESATTFPRRSYPIDFVAWMMELLIVVALSTTVMLHVRGVAGISLYSGVAGASLLYENSWLVLSRLKQFSSVGKVAESTRWNNLSFVALALGYGISRAAGADAVLADQVGLFGLLAVTFYDIAGLVRRFDS